MRLVTAARPNIFVRLLSWFGSHEKGFLLTAGGIAGGVLFFAELADRVVDGATRGFDRTLLLSLRHPDLTPLGPRQLQEAARDITALGSVVVLTLITCGVCLYLALAGRKRLSAFVFGSISSGMLVSTLLKDIFQRPRPHLVPVSVYINTASFPSGHSMLSAITYLTLAALLARSEPRRAVRAYLILAALLLTTLVGISRVYLGVHWPTDVLAGWTAGCVWALLCRVLAERWLNRDSS